MHVLAARHHCYRWRRQFMRGKASLLFGGPRGDSDADRFAKYDRRTKESDGCADRDLLAVGPKAPIVPIRDRTRLGQSTENIGGCFRRTQAGTTSVRSNSPRQTLRCRGRAILKGWRN
jgi:hypothetical protein